MASVAAARGDTGPGEPGRPSPPPLEALPAGRWPQQLSHQPTMRVGDVLALVGREFPALTTSKLRFLDTQGLVTPCRTEGGYRAYSAADVERLRFVLREQRDRFLPLGAIAERLASLDAGAERLAVSPYPLSDEQSDRLGPAELARAAGVPAELVGSLQDEGFLPTAVPGGFPRSAVPVVVAAARYLDAGGDLRALRVLRTSASREAARAEGQAAPLRARGSAGAADERAAEYGDAAIAFFAAAVRAELARGRSAG